MEGQTKTKKNRGREFFSLSSSSRHFLLSLLFYFRRGLHSFCGLRYLLSRSSLNSALPLERSAKRLKRRCRFKTKQHKTHDKTHDKTRWPRRMRSSSPSPDLLFLRAFASPPLPVFRKTRPRPTRPPASVGLAAPSGRQLSAARTPERLLGNRNPGPAAPPARAVAVCSVAAAAVAAGGAVDSTTSKRRKRKKKKNSTTTTTSQRRPDPMPPPAPIEQAASQSAPAGASGAMQVVFVATEVAPWSKVGGLGDVMAALPAALASR